jgi:hypothetical protein
MCRSGGERFAHGGFEQRCGEYVQLANHRHHTYSNGWASNGHPEQLRRRARADGPVQMIGSG